MNKLISEHITYVVYYPSELYYSGAYTTPSIQVMKLLIKSLILQKPSDNAVFLFIVNTGIYMCTIATIRDHMYVSS